MITDADVPDVVAALLAKAAVPGPPLGEPAEDRGRTISWWGVEIDEADLEWAMEAGQSLRPRPQRPVQSRLSLSEFLAEFMTWVYEGGDLWS